MSRELLQQALDALSAEHHFGDYDDLCAALRSALAAPMPEPWMPIETAPKDGTTIIVGRDMGDFGFVRGTSYWAGAGFVSGWVSRGFTDPPGELGLGHPTHWMPLPAAPGATPPSAPAPGDMVMVPREPTIAMCLAGDGARHNVDDATRSPAVYRAMIAAAPSAAPAPVVPLTDEQMWRLWNSQGDDAMEQAAAIKFARAIERTHGIGGGK